jgi:hypothetical protein
MPRILSDLADGSLSDAEADAVVDWLLASSNEQPPSWVVNRAIRIPRSEDVGHADVPSVWRRVVAALVYDNRVEPQLAGVRAVAIEQPRLMYQAAGVEIDLEVRDSRLAGRLRVLGQVTAGDNDLRRAWVAATGPEGRTEGRVDTLGQFSLDGLVTGRHSLEIGLSKELIEIPEVNI